MRRPAQGSPPAAFGPRSILTVLALVGALAAPSLLPAAESALAQSFSVETDSALVLRGFIPENSIFVRGSVSDPQRRGGFGDRGAGAIVATGFWPGRPVPVPSFPRVPPPGSLPPAGRQHQCCGELQFPFPEDVGPSEVDLEEHSTPAEEVEP